MIFNAVNEINGAVQEIQPLSVSPSPLGAKEMEAQLDLNPFGY